MHNLNMGSQLTQAQERTNWSTIENACSKDMYSYWLNAEMLGDGGHAAGATYVVATLSGPSYWALADCVVSGVAAYVRRHAEWKAGSFKVKVHWTSDAAGDNVRFGACVAPVQEDAAYPTYSVMLGNTVAGPGTANYTQVTEFNESTLAVGSAIDPADVGVMVGLRRATSGDTNTGIVKIFGIELIYFETQRVVGEGFLR